MRENLPSPTIKSWLNHAANQLTDAGIPTARLDAEILLAHTLRQPRTWLHAHSEEVLDSRTIDIAQARLDLRLDRVPIAYIVGHKEFYGYSFKVTTATLIPRPESESLIELLKLAVPKNIDLTSSPYKIVDVGTGSGALGIVAKLLYPSSEVSLIDQSRYALSVAEKNALQHKVDVEIIESDLLSNYSQVADCIIANLPYVDESWQRSPETNHEPASALFADDGGLALIKQLIRETRGKLSSNGSLILEADPEQHKSIIKSATSEGLILVKTDGYGLLFEKLR